MLLSDLQRGYQTGQAGHQGAWGQQGGQQQGQQSQQAQTYEQTDPSGQTPGSIRNAVSYQRPIHAMLNGQPVSLIAHGDIVGMSPAEKFVNSEGRIDWASSEDFVVDDQQVVPQSLDQRNRLLQKGQQQFRR